VASALSTAALSSERSVAANAMSSLSLSKWAPMLRGQDLMLSRRQRLYPQYNGNTKQWGGPLYVRIRSSGGGGLMPLDG